MAETHQDVKSLEADPNQINTAYVGGDDHDDDNRQELLCFICTIVFYMYICTTFITFTFRATSDGAVRAGTTSRRQLTVFHRTVI